MKALTLRPVWAWAVIFGGKNIENHAWKTDYRGPLIIHAGSSHGLVGEFDVAEIEKLACTMVPYEIEVGAVIGVVDLVAVLPAGPHLAVDCFERCCNIWTDARARFHWVLRNPRPVVPVDYKGGLRLWEFPDTQICFDPDKIFSCPRHTVQSTKDTATPC